MFQENTNVCAHGQIKSRRFGLLTTILDHISDWVARSRTRARLYQLSDHMLCDVGLSRGDVEAEFQKPFWRA
jgi:uncharacterized protein YjiS (DUF1127 family)